MARTRAAGRWRLAPVFAAILLPPVGAARPAGAETVHVVMANLAFAPASLSAQLSGGEAGFSAPHAHVIWTVEDPGTQHTVTFDDPRLASSERVAAGQRFEIVIYMPGTFTYHCTIHPTMTGSLTVTPGPAAPPTSAAVAAPASPGRQASGDSGSGSAALAIGLGLLAGTAGLALLLLWRRRQPAAARAPGD